MREHHAFRSATGARRINYCCCIILGWRENRILHGAIDIFAFADHRLPSLGVKPEA